MLRHLTLPLAGVLIGFFLSHGIVVASLADEERWKSGKRLLAEGKAREALEAFQALLGRYSKEPDLHLFSALASLRLGNVHKTESYIKETLSLAPDHVEARTLLGWLKLELRNDLPGAIEAYARVVKLRPRYPEAHNNLGVALKKKGDLDRALESFDRALELSPGYAEAWVNRGWVYVEQNKWREAQRDFKQALMLNENDDAALYGLSRALRGSRDYAGAQSQLRKLIGRSSNFVYWLEWAELHLVRFYWVLLLVAIGLFLRFQYKKRTGVKSYGG